MATVPSIVHGWTNTTNGTSATGGADFTPSATLATIAFAVAVDDSGAVPSFTLSGCGMTWTGATDGTTNQNQADPNTRGRIRAFIATAGTPSSGKLTIDCGATTCERFILRVVELTETTFGVQPVQCVKNSGTSATPTATFGAVADAANILLVAYIGRNPAVTFTGGWTGLADLSVETDVRLKVMYTTNDTTADGDWSGSCDWAAIGLELDNVPAASGWGRMLGQQRFRIVTTD